MYGTAHVSTGAIYRNTDWEANCSQSKDIIKLDFSTSAPRPLGLKFSIYDVDNGSDSVSALMYQAGVPLPYSYSLYSPTFVTAYGIQPSFGFVGSGGNNTLQDDNRGRIDITLDDVTASVDSVIITKYNNRNVVGNPSQSFAAFQWNNFAVLPLKIIAFDANMTNNDVMASWTATGEDGTEAYQVALSTNGINFQTFGSPVTAKNNGVINSYSSKIYFPNNNTTLFARLQSLTKDGKLTYSNIIKLKTSHSLSSTVYPAIFRDLLTLNLTSSKASTAVIKITSMNGALQYQTTTAIQSGINSIQMRLTASLSAGTYILYYQLKDGSRGQHSIIKQ